MACRHCSNYIFILYLTPGFNRAETNARRDENHLSFWIWLSYIRDFTVINCQDNRVVNFCLTSHVFFVVITTHTYPPLMRFKVTPTLNMLILCSGSMKTYMHFFLANVKCTYNLFATLTCYWKPPSSKTKNCIPSIVNTMAYDGLATQGTRASAAMLLTEYFSLSTRKVNSTFLEDQIN